MLAEVLITLIALLNAVAVPLMVCWAIYYLTVGKGRKQRLLQIDESRLIQEVHCGLTGMEERIEVLETLLLKQDRKGK